MSVLRAVASRSKLVDGREVLLLLGLVTAYLISTTTFNGDGTHPINLFGPSALMVILLAGSWWHVKRQPLAIWQPLFWFRIACVAYYGVGNLAPYVANEVTMLSIRTLYNFNETEAVKVGLINATCVLTVLTTVWVLTELSSAKFAARGALIQSPQTDVSRTLLFAAIFLICGGIIRYFVVLPFNLGIVAIIPGILIPLGKSYIVGLFLLILAGLRGRRGALVLAAVLVTLDLAIGLLTFAKVEVLLTLIFSYLAILHHKLTRARVFLGLLIILGIYSQLDPVIHFGRNEIFRQYASTAAPLSVRIGILQSYGGSAGEDYELSQRQSALFRLSYINAATMVTTWHDNGRPGDTLKYALIVLIPRIFWPDKPIITAAGTDLYLAASSMEGSSISPGIFAETYWNMGWWGLPMVMGVLGVMFSVFSHYSLRTMAAENWLHLPVVLLGVQIGTRVDGWLVSDFVGGTSTALAIVIPIKLYEHLTKER